MFPLLFLIQNNIVFLIGTMLAQSLYILSFLQHEVFISLTYLSFSFKAEPPIMYALLLVL